VGIIEVGSPDDPRLRDYANLTDAQLRDADWAGERGVFIAEGELVVRRLLASRFAVRSLLVTQAGLERIGDAAALLPEGTPVFLIEQGLMADVVGFPFHRGILACGERPATVPLEQVLGTVRTLVVLEDLSNADNVGAVFRNVGALAGPGSAVLLSPGCCDPLYRKSLRVSMGQALRVPFTRVAPWPGSLKQVSAAGFELIGLTPDPAAVDIGRYPRPPGGRLALLLGAEGPGLTEAAFGHCRVRVRVPMDPGADSLNVATALAVALAALR
jgi:tRNA G18 (ribose-2'-O)-methylase SpoU